MTLAELAALQDSTRQRAWEDLSQQTGDVPSLECAFLLRPDLGRRWEAELDRIRWEMVRRMPHVVHDVTVEMARRYRRPRTDLDSYALIGCYKAAVTLDLSRKNGSYETLCFWWARRTVREHIREVSHPCKTSRRCKVRTILTVDVHTSRTLAGPNNRPDIHLLETEEDDERILAMPLGTRAIVRRIRDGETIGAVASETGMRRVDVIRAMEEARR